MIEHGWSDKNERESPRGMQEGQHVAFVKVANERFEKKKPLPIEAEKW
jgi:hypothetical protein